MRLFSEVIPLKERSSMLFLQYGRLDVEGGALVFAAGGNHDIPAPAIGAEHTPIPVGSLACILLEPGTTITYAAVALAAECGTLLLWVGEAGVRLYSAGLPGGSRADRLLQQARLALDPVLRTRIALSMFKYRFHEAPDSIHSIEQLRGLEGTRVRALYQSLARKAGIEWERRTVDETHWDKKDTVNAALSVANHCLYGVCEAAILAAGYSPAIGFVHTGQQRSFVYDIADMLKFETVVPAAFAVAAQWKDTQTASGENLASLSSAVRHACRDQFRKQDILKKLIPLIEKTLSAGGVGNSGSKTVDTPEVKKPDRKLPKTGKPAAEQPGRNSTVGTTGTTPPGTQQTHSGVPRTTTGRPQRNTNNTKRK